MQNQYLQNPGAIAGIYKKVIDAFKLRSDVQSGYALAYKGSNQIPTFDNRPKGYGDATTTTGLCVSGSQALLNDNCFNDLIHSRGAVAKLVSIDIKEQYYGYCGIGGGSQNKWHTAILLQDSGIFFIVDITCGQFGNSFVNKNIWDFKTWELTFRSPSCKHFITDFQNNPLTILPITQTDKAKIHTEVSSVDVFDSMHDLTNFTDIDRKLLTDFFVNRFDELNNKIILGNINQEDFKYIESVNELLEHMPFVSIEMGYSIMKFNNKEAAKNWLRLFLNNQATLNKYMLISKDFKNASCAINVDSEEINIEKLDDLTTYIVFEFGKVYGIDVDFLSCSDLLIPFGYKLEFDTKNIMNGGKRNAIVSNGGVNPFKETNAIYIRIDNFQ